MKYKNEFIRGKDSVRMEKLCNYCRGNICPLESNLGENELCIFNVIIYQDEIKTLFYNLSEKRIFLIEKGIGFKEIDFKDAIREIDTIPTEKPEWKRLQILNLARDLGFFGIN